MQHTAVSELAGMCQNADCIPKVGVYL